MATYAAHRGRQDPSASIDYSEIDSFDMRYEYAELEQYIHDNYNKLRNQPEAVEKLAQKVIGVSRPCKTAEPASIEDLCRSLFESRISGKKPTTLPNGLVPALANQIFNALNYKLPENLAIEMFEQNPDGSTGLVEPKTYVPKLNYSGPFQPDPEVIIIPKDRERQFYETMNPFDSFANIDKVTRFGPSLKIDPEEARKSRGRFKRCVRDVIGTTVRSHHRVLRDIESLLHHKEPLIKFRNPDVALGNSLNLWGDGLEPWLYIGDPEVVIQSAKKTCEIRKGLAGKILDGLHEMYTDHDDHWVTAEEIVTAMFQGPPEPLHVDPLLGPEKPRDLAMLTPESRQKLAQAMSKHPQFATSNQGYVEYLEKDPVMKLLTAFQNSKHKQENYWYVLEQDARLKSDDTPFMRDLEAYFVAEADRKKAVEERISWAQTLKDAERTAYQLWHEEIQRNRVDMEVYMWRVRARALGIPITVPAMPKLQVMPRDKQYRFVRDAVNEPREYDEQLGQTKKQAHNVRPSDCDVQRRAQLCPFFEAEGESIRDEKVRLFKKLHADDDGVYDSEDLSGDVDES